MSFNLFLLAVALAWTPFAQGALPTVPFKVVIDPGHGGTDEGAVLKQGRYQVAEKNITLALSHQVASQLKARGFSVKLTREKDEEVQLPERTAMANRFGADIFISIHMNFSENNENAEGVETFILNSTTDASSKRLAYLENSGLSPLGQTHKQSQSQTDVALILKDLSLDANLSESKRLACDIQGHLVQATRLHPGHSPGHSMEQRRNRGVKQALFYVLLGANMPSILVEAGFLSSPRDRTLLLSPEGQLRMSRAIADAVDTYRSQKRSRVQARVDHCKIVN